VRYTFVFFVFVVLSVAAPADTVTLTTRTSWNGRVEYKGDEFILHARFAGSTTRIFHWPRTEVAEIEINENDYNQGRVPLWLTSDSITGCLVGSPDRSKFLVVPDNETVALEVSSHQKLAESMGKTVTLTGQWKSESQPSSEQSFEVHSVAGSNQNCQDAQGDWKKLLHVPQSYSLDPSAKPRPNGSSESLPCTDTKDAVVLLDDAKHEGCLGEINKTSVIFANSRDGFPRKRVRLIIVGKD
jgi:hypothetical protein